MYNMLHDDPGNVSYSVVGGLSDQIWELRESIELPLMNFELFMHVGIKPPKVLHNLVFSIKLQRSRVLICDCC
jgi:ATP-dependent 26S proteasome regulatory subunit